MNEIEQFVKIASEILKTIGLLVGGAWTVWSFTKLQRIKIAEVEHKLKLAELLRQQPVLDISINKISAPDLGEDNSCVGIVVTLENKGEQNLKVMFENDCVTIGRVRFDDTGIQQIENLRSLTHSYLSKDANNGTVEVPYRFFRAGQVRQLAFCAPIRESGPYIIQFRASYLPTKFDQPEAVSGAVIEAVQQGIFFLGDSQCLVDAQTHMVDNQQRSAASIRISSDEPELVRS